MVTVIDFPAGTVLPNKYLTWYLKICSVPGASEYTENHHIVPRSFGGPNIKSNRIRLSARAHYIAHVLLIRCSVGLYKRKAALAAHYMMSGCDKHKRQGIGSSRSYEFVRREFANAQRGRIVKAETRQKIGLAHRGKVISDSAKQKMGNSLKRRHPFYLFDGETYSHQVDFYRFCAEHKIGRSQVQAGLRATGVHVILAGKHKGKCFSWEDIGFEASRRRRDQAIVKTREARAQMTSNAWKLKRAKNLEQK